MVDNTEAARGQDVHPLIHAGKWLLAELLSTLTFVFLYAVFHNIFIATGFAIALGIGQIGYLKWRGASIDRMQWLSLILVLVFGGTSLLTGNPVFVMMKPTLIYCALGAVMLTPDWMNRYAPPIARARAADLLTTFGYVWAGLMFATAIANLAVALLASASTWGWFIGIFPTASKIVLVAVQYMITRTVVRRRIRASATPPLVA